MLAGVIAFLVEAASYFVLAFVLMDILGAFESIILHGCPIEIESYLLVLDPSWNPFVLSR